MEGAKMVDKTNMSLDDIIKMDRKKFNGKPAFSKKKNTLARNVVKKAKNSFLNKKPINSPKKNLTITEKRVDVRSRLLKTKQFNRNNVNPQNVQRVTRNSNFQTQNRRLNISSKSRMNNSKLINSAPAFRITTNNERYQSINQRTRPVDRPSTKRIAPMNNFNTYSSTRSQNSFYSRSRRPFESSGNFYQSSHRSDSGNIRRNPPFSRDREYEAMARALIEAHRESRYPSFSQQLPPQRRYSALESRGYLYRR